VIWLLTLAISVRLATFLCYFFRIHPPHFSPISSHDYGYLAAQIAHHVPYGLHYTLLGPDPSIGINPYRPPLYPWLLSWFLGIPWAFIFLQVLISILTVLILWLFLTKQFGRKAASLACLFPAFHWTAIHQAILTEADTFFAFFVVAAFCITWETLEEKTNV